MSLALCPEIWEGWVAADVLEAVEERISRLAENFQDFCSWP